MAAQVGTNGHHAGEPDSKRLRSDQANGKDEAWADEWAEVFSLMQEGDMEERATEYAEAVVAIKKNAETLIRQRKTVLESCEQLLHTAYREALQAHLKSLMEAAATGASQELVDAAKRTVDDMCPPETSSLQQTGPMWKASQPVAAHVGVGIPQPGLGMAEPKAIGLAAIPSRLLAAPKAGAPAPGASMDQQHFSQIGQFAAAAAQAQQEAATAQTSLHVSGLPEGIDDAMLRTLFARYGSISSTKLMGNKRESYIKYFTKDHAQAAINALNGFECNGVKLSVRFASYGPAIPSFTIGAGQA